MIALHDHVVREFTVNVDAKTLRLLTTFPKSDGPNRAEAVFEGLQGYVIDGDALGTIILNVEEVDALSLYDEFSDSIRETFSRSGGHAPWAEHARPRSASSGSIRLSDIHSLHRLGSQVPSGHNPLL